MHRKTSWRIAAKFPSMHARKTHFGKCSLVLSDTLKNFAAITVECIADRADVALECLATSQLVSQRSTKRKFVAQQSVRCVKVTSIPYSFIKCVNKLRSTQFFLL